MRQGEKMDGGDWMIDTEKIDKNREECSAGGVRDELELCLAFLLEKLLKRLFNYQKGC